MAINVGIYLFDEVELLDFAGPYEVFTTANRVFLRQQADAESSFNVFTISQGKQWIHSRAGLKVMSEYAIGLHPTVDVLLIPGGIVDAESSKTDVIDWIKSTAQKASITSSVCTGAFLLAQAGLLEGKSATTHWEDIPALKNQFDQIHVLENTPWVDEGSIVTSAGISAGIDMSLHLVERLVGRVLALETAKQMQYNWSESYLIPSAKHD